MNFASARRLRLGLAALLASALVSSSFADDPRSKIHGLIQVEFSDHYITPRGLHIENEGVVVQPLLLLFWNLYASETATISDVTLTTGVWNSVHTNKNPGEAEPSHWNEIDPFAGLTFKFAKAWQFDVFYTGFQSQTDSYTTSTNLSLKLTYADKWFDKFSINPYVEYFDEVTNKATVAFGGTEDDTGFYFQIGATPTIPLPKGMKLQFPTYVSLVSSNFYHQIDGSDGGSGVGLFSTQAKLSFPIKMPAGYGFWNGYVGVQYYHLVNDGLLDGNRVLGAQGFTLEEEKDLLQFHTGFSVFF
ncbi:MAG: hypothetical protein K0R17_1986 [Rariglobus sp.]|jgi:hypothetical protein|nr:hypothetical protein [Rariglobus sp.]